LLLGPEEDTWAVIVLMVSGVTDWADGKLARALGQSSRLGALLDPAADRLYILATLGAFVARDIIPWWLAALVIGRDLILLPTLPLLRRHRYNPLNVSYVGKAATFNLLYAFPLILLGAENGMDLALARVLGWAFALWGTGLYWWAGWLYLAQTYRLIRSTPRLPKLG
jgi:cardiolipin synthase